MLTSQKGRKMKTDFNQIIFNPTYHSYTYQGQRLASVASTVYKLRPPFDPDGTIAAKSAAKAGVTVEEIKAQWEAKRQASMDRGSRVHGEIAKLLDPTEEEVKQLDPYLALNIDLPEVKVFKSLWAEMLNSGNMAFNVEWVVGDAELGLAGTCDLLAHNIQTGYHLLDWKTGGKFDTSNRFGKLLAPFDDLDDCEFNIYSLQLATYRLMIERNAGLSLGDSYIVHLREDGHQFHKALDLRERVLGWLRANV